MGFNRVSLRTAVFLSCSSLIVGSSQTWLRAVVELIQKGIQVSLPASSSIPLLLFSDCRIHLSFTEGSSRVNSKRNSGKLTGEQHYFSPAFLLWLGSSQAWLRAVVELIQKEIKWNLTSWIKLMEGGNRCFHMYSHTYQACRYFKGGRNMWQGHVHHMSTGR